MSHHNPMQGLLHSSSGSPRSRPNPSRGSTPSGQKNQPTSIPVPAGLLPPALHKPLLLPSPSSLVNIPDIYHPTQPLSKAEPHIRPFFPWSQNLDALPFPQKQPLQALPSSFPLQPAHARIRSSDSLDHACLLRSHVLFNGSLTPNSPASVIHPQTLPLNTWMTIDGPSTHDRDDAIKVTPSELHIAIPLRAAPSSWLIPSSIYLPGHTQHLCDQNLQFSLTAQQSHRCLVLSLRLHNGTLIPSWAIDNITVAFNTTYEHIDSLLQSAPSEPWQQWLDRFPPSPLSPQASPSATFVEALMTLTNSVAASALANVSQPLFWKKTTAPTPPVITPLTIPPTAFSTSKPHTPWPLCYAPWIQQLAFPLSSCYLQITSPLRRKTDAYNIAYLAHSLFPSVQPAPPPLPPGYSDLLLNTLFKHIRNTQNFASFQSTAVAYFNNCQKPTLATIQQHGTLDPKAGLLKSKIETPGLPPLIINLPLKNIAPDLRPLIQPQPLPILIQWNPAIPKPYAHQNNHYLLTYMANPLLLSKT